MGAAAPIIIATAAGHAIAIHTTAAAVVADRDRHAPFATIVTVAVVDAANRIAIAATDRGAATGRDHVTARIAHAEGIDDRAVATEHAHAVMMIRWVFIKLGFPV